MATTDTYTLNVDATVDDAQAKVDALVEELEGRTVELDASIAEPDTSAVDTALADLEDETVEIAKPVVPAPDVQPTKDKLTELDTASDKSKGVLANLTGNVAGDLAGMGGAASSTGVAIGQLAEYATEGGISLGGLAAAAGPMLALTAAVEIGTRAWKAYTDKSNLTKKTTQEVSDALTEQSGALQDVAAALDDIVEAGDASGWDRLNQALLEGLDEGEVKKITGALGDLGMTFEDLSPALAAIEDDTDDARAGMERLAAQGGIPDEYVATIADAVHAGEDMGEITNRLAQDFTAQGMEMTDAREKAEGLTDTYGTQIKALEQLNDAQQNSDLQKIAEDQLDVARGATLASAALVHAAEAAAGPDASALDIWQEYIRLQNEAAVAAEEQAAAAEQAARAAEGAAEFADVMAGADFQRAEIEGAASAMSTYSDALFAAGNQAQAADEAYAGLGEALADNGLQFGLTTEAGFAQQDALEKLAAVVDTQLVDAFDNANGSFDDFKAGAESIRDDVLGTLTDELGLTETEAGRVADALGLTEGDYAARFELAGAEAATAQLALLSGAMEGLPDDVRREVEVAILAGDPSVALGTMQDYYNENFPEVVAEVTGDTEGFRQVTDEAMKEAESRNPVIDVYADTSEADDQMEDSADAAPDATIETDADTSEAGDDMQAEADAAPGATIAADADTTEASSQLLDEASRHRTATIYALADFMSAKAVLDSLKNPRTAHVTAVALTAHAENELNHTARNRTSYVTQVTRSGGRTSSPSSSAVAASTRAGVAPYAAAPVANVTINTAVIGDRYDVQRVVTRAVRSSVRLAGGRTLAGVHG